MRTLIVIVGLLVSFRLDASEMTNPRIVFEKEYFDFGTLIQGAQVTCQFPFRNEGTGSLRIESVSVSCGCTLASAGEQMVPSKGKSEIKVQYNSKGKMGNISKVILVNTNDHTNRTVRLYITGLVVPSQHPELTGPQNLFSGECRSCHVDRGVGKMGEDLYRMDCAMCHEHHNMGGAFIAPSAKDMAGHLPAYLQESIRNGRPGKSMPAYHQDHGGPLNTEEIDSLVHFINRLSEASDWRYLPPDTGVNENN